MQKVDMAKKMLIESDVSITDVAFSLGFSSSNYFCMVFKKIRSCTTSNFRQNNRHML